MLQVRSFFFAADKLEERSSHVAAVVMLCSLTNTCIARVTLKRPASASGLGSSHRKGSRLVARPVQGPPKVVLCQRERPVGMASLLEGGFVASDDETEKVAKETETAPVDKPMKKLKCELCGTSPV